MEIYCDTVFKGIFDVLDRILYFSIVRTIPFNPPSFADFLFFSSLCESYQRCDILALSQFISATVSLAGHRVMFIVSSLDT